MLNSLFQGPVWWLVAGFFLGWLLELILDYIFWRRRERRLAEDVDTLQTSLNNALNEKTAVEVEADSVRERVTVAESQYGVLKEQIVEKEEHITHYETKLSSADMQLRQMAAVEQANDTLRSKLADAEERVAELAAKETYLTSQLSDFETRIDSSGEVTNLKMSLVSAQQQVEQLSQEKQSLRDKLADAEAEVATMSAQYSTASDDSSTVMSLQNELATSRTEVESLRASLASSTASGERAATLAQEQQDLQVRLESAENELLTEHNKLVAAEVKLQNMADKLTDERMRAQMLEKRLDGADVPVENNTKQVATLQMQLDSANREIADLRMQRQSTPATAATMFSAAPVSADPDKLQKIKGIGDVFARRLNKANIFTYAQLASQGSEQIVDIVKAEPWQAVDADSWIAQARQLAAAKEA